VSKFKRGGGGIELLKFSHRFSLFTKQGKIINLFCNKQIYFTAYFIKTVFQISDFKVLSDFNREHINTLISINEK